MQKALLVVGLLILLAACSEPEPTSTPTPTLTPTLVPTPTPTLTPAPTATPTPEPTATFTPTPTATPIPSPTATYTPTATATPTPSPTPTFTPTPTPTPTNTPTPTPTFTPTPVPTWPASETSGDWIVRDRGVDALTELHGVSLFLLSSDEERRLQVRCNIDPRRPNSPEVLIIWDDEIEDEEPEITWRLDDHGVVTSNWNRASGGEATFYQGNVQNLVWRLMNSDKLVARIFTVDHILTATFELEGLAEALRPFKDDCDWVGF